MVEHKDAHLIRRERYASSVALSPDGSGTALYRARTPDSKDVMSPATFLAADTGDGIGLSTICQSAGHTKSPQMTISCSFNFNFSFKLPFHSLLQNSAPERSRDFSLEACTRCADIPCACDGLAGRTDSHADPH